MELVSPRRRKFPLAGSPVFRSGCGEERFATRGCRGVHHHFEWTPIHPQVFAFSIHSDLYHDEHGRAAVVPSRDVCERETGHVLGNCKIPKGSARFFIRLFRFRDLGSEARERSDGKGALGVFREGRGGICCLCSRGKCGGILCPDVTFNGRAEFCRKVCSWIQLRSRGCDREMSR